MEYCVYFKAEYRYTNIPKFLQELVARKYMENRCKVVELFNSKIDEVNEHYESTGKPFAFGEYEEDINPEYVACIRKYIQPLFDEANKHFYVCRYMLGEYGQIIGYVPFIRNSKIELFLKPLD